MLRLMCMRATALLVVLALAGCGTGSVQATPQATPSARAVDQSTRPGGGPAVPCEDPHAIIDRVATANSLDGLEAWAVVDAVASHRAATASEGGGYPTEVVQLNTVERVRGTVADEVLMSPRSREDLAAWLAPGSDHRALVGQFRGDQPFVEPFVVDGSSVYNLTTCAYPGSETMSRYAAHVGGDPFEALVALARAGQGSAAWTAWEQVVDPPPPRPKTWDELTPDQRSLDVSAPVPTAIRSQLRSMMITFTGLTPAWRRLGNAATQVVGVAWNDGTSLNASQMDTLTYSETWLPGKGLQLWLVVDAPPAFRGVVKIADVPVEGRSGDVRLTAALDPGITSVEELKAAVASGRSVVTWS